MQLYIVLTFLGAWLINQVSCAPVQVTVTAQAVTVTAKIDNPILSIAMEKKFKYSKKKYHPSATVSLNSSKISEIPTSVSASLLPSVSTTATPSKTLLSPGPLKVSQEQFLHAWEVGKVFLPDPNVSAPTAQQYKAFISNAATAGGISSNTELAMFLAEIMWESGGLVYKSELACAANGPTPNCPGNYQDSTGIPGKYYYGRGYIQLSWGANYKAASQDLFQNDSLLKDPDQVASNEDKAWGVSFWYWKSRVKPALNNTFNFGLATKAINGNLECSGDSTKAKKRYFIYKAILDVFEPSATPIESGCYN